MKRCAFTLLARADLRDIYDYIAAKDPDSALDFVTRLQLMCERLAEMPGLGRKRAEIAEDIRGFPVERYIIFYRIIEDGVEILRVLHGSRDMEGIFAGE